MRSEVFDALDQCWAMIGRIFLHSSAVSIILYILLTIIALRIFLLRFKSNSMISHIVKPVISLKTLNWSIDYEKAEQLTTQNARWISLVTFTISIIIGALFYGIKYSSPEFSEPFDVLSGTFQGLKPSEWKIISIFFSGVVLLMVTRIYNPGQRFRNAVRKLIVKRTSFTSSSLEELAVLETLVNDCHQLAHNLGANLTIEYAQDVKDFIQQNSARIFINPKILERFIDNRTKPAKVEKKKLELLDNAFSTTIKLYNDFTTTANNSGRKSMIDIAEVIVNKLKFDHIRPMVEARKYDDLQKDIISTQKQLKHLLATVHRKSNGDQGIVSVNYYQLLELDQSASENEILTKLKEKKRIWTQRQNAPTFKQRQEANKLVDMIPDIEINLLDAQKRTAYNQSL